MAYRFKLSEPFDEGVRRIGIQQIDRALEQLQSGQATAVSVHATRKGLKRIRALLRLARPGLGDSVYRNENARYRDVARLLSGLRDDVVVMETVRTFETAASGKTKSAFAAAKVRLAQGAETAAKQNGAIDEAVSGLVEGRRHMGNLTISGAEYKCAWEGLERGYRQAERAFETALDTRDNEDVHQWRKQVQYHWRHMMLICEAWPEEMAARIATARELSAHLGQDHDIAVMIATLTDDAAGDVSRAGPGKFTGHQRKLASAFALERQTALRREADRLSQRLFAESASAFRNRVETYWMAAVAGRDKGGD
jgi:CHAD domain-containing protein